MSGQLVEFNVDNIAVRSSCALINLLKGASPDASHPAISVLCCHYNFWFLTSHIAGKLNTGSDALSRNNYSLFLSQVPNATQEPAMVPLSYVCSIPANREHHMDVHGLDGIDQHYFTAALAQSSHKTYRAAANKYLTFCEIEL